MSDWKWLEEIENVLKEYKEEKPHLIESIFVKRQSKLIACIKEMRETLEFVARPEKLGEQGDPWTYRKNAVTETLTRSAEGKFRQDGDKGDVQ